MMFSFSEVRENTSSQPETEKFLFKKNISAGEFKKNLDEYLEKCQVRLFEQQQFCIDRVLQETGYDLTHLEQLNAEANRRIQIFLQRLYSLYENRTGIQSYDIDIERILQLIEHTLSLVIGCELLQKIHSKRQYFRNGSLQKNIFSPQVPFSDVVGCNFHSEESSPDETETSVDNTSAKEKPSPFDEIIDESKKDNTTGSQSKNIGNHNNE